MKLPVYTFVIHKKYNKKWIKDIMIQVKLNIELFMHIIFIMYGFVGTLNLLNGVFKTEKNKSTHNGITEIIAGIIMLGICIAVVIL